MRRTSPKPSLAGVLAAMLAQPMPCAVFRRHPRDQVDLLQVEDRVRIGRIVACSQAAMPPDVNGFAANGDVANCGQNEAIASERQVGIDTTLCSMDTKRKLLLH